MKPFLIIVCALMLGAAVNGQTIRKLKVTELQAYIAASDHPLVVNFWATFCEPCVQEIPYFESEVSKYKDAGVELLLVSMDLPSYYPTKIQQFVRRRSMLQISSGSTKPMPISFAR